MAQPFACARLAPPLVKVNILGMDPARFPAGPTCSAEVRTGAVRAKGLMLVRRGCHYARLRSERNGGPRETRCRCVSAAISSSPVCLSAIRRSGRDADRGALISERCSDLRDEERCRREDAQRLLALLLQNAAARESWALREKRHTPAHEKE